jgi:hypothetical protein
MSLLNHWRFAAAMVAYIAPKVWWADEELSSYNHVSFITAFRESNGGTEENHRKRTSGGVHTPVQTKLGAFETHVCDISLFSYFLR